MLYRMDRKPCWKVFLNMMTESFLCRNPANRNDSRYRQTRRDALLPHAFNESPPSVI